MEHFRVGVLGAGYWGPNVIRTFAGLPDCEVAWVCDQRPGRLQYIAERFPDVRLTNRYDDLLEDPTLTAIAIVTPVSSHRALGEAALQAGKHVFIEKPLAPTPEDAASLVTTAQQAGRVLATGHLFVYHAAIARLRQAAQSGELGRLCYAESARVNLGPPASEVDVLWDLAVHDVAVLLSILGEEPVEVICEGHRYVHPTLVDVAFLTLRFANGFVAQHHVSWLSPMKVRRFFLAGTEGSGVFDDMRDEGRLLLTDKGEDSRIGAKDTDNKELFYKPGEIRAPALSPIPPLTAELAHFLDCIRTGRTPEADGRAGLAVVRVLDAAEQSIVQGGAPVRLSAAPFPMNLEARP